MELKNTFVVLIFGLWANIAFAQDANFNNFSVNQNTAQTVADALINPFDGQNNLYEQIFNTLNSEYEHIGKLEAQKILDNKWTITGGINSVGFSYRRPFLDFGLSLDRSLAPDLFSNSRWIVTDTFTIHIDASKIINKLKDKNAINISEKNLVAFAGVVFERKFTWQHFANSYDEGLSTHFEKLFFPFRGVKFDSIQKLETDEIITKEDSISVNAGGFVSAPIYTGISAMGGALFKFQKLSKMEMTRQGQIDGSQDALMLSYEKGSHTIAGVSMSVQADFLKILRMTLLSYDFYYEKDASNKIYTKFPMNEILEMDATNPIALEIGKIIKTKPPELEIIGPYIISEEKKISETLTHKYNFLLLGGSKEAKTQSIEVTKNGIVKTFFRHNYEKIKYTEDALSRLISSFIFRIFNSDLKAANMVSDTKKVTIEYDSNKNLLDANEDLNIENGDNQTLSLQFQGEYMTKKTTGMFGKKYKERAKFILDNYSGVDPMAINMIESDQLIAPYNVDGTYQVNMDGIRYLNAQSVGTIFDNIDGLCDEKPKTIFSKFRSLFSTCKLSVQNDYIAYLKDLSHDKVSEDLISKCEKKAWKYVFSPSKKRAFIKNCLGELSLKNEKQWVEVPLMPLKNFSQSLVNNIDSKVYYYNIFGLNNVFFHGTFTATTIEGAAFATYFHEGTFKGLGVVDHYMRTQNLRSPASIVVDQ